jgi:uncharacterized repeat protein (TIGR01451 family)
VYKVGTDTKRLGVVVMAMALAMVSGASVLLLGPTGRSASAQNDSPLTLQLFIRPPVLYFVGERVRFTIRETNNSEETFPEVAVRNLLPEGATEFVSATPSQGECSYAPSVHNVFCELGDLPAGGSAEVEIVATSTAPGRFTNTAFDILNNREDIEATVNEYVAGEDPTIDETIRNTKAGLFESPNF